jgi:hypothetical protein
MDASNFKDGRQIPFEYCITTFKDYYAEHGPIILCRDIATHTPTLTGCKLVATVAWGFSLDQVR